MGAAVLGDEELNACLAVALDLAGQACKRIAEGSPGPDGVYTKAHDADWVTDADRSIEDRVRQVLLGRFPDHQVVGEERGASPESPRGVSWYVDPIDGTTNFVHGIGWSSFSLGLLDEAGPAVGVVADPYRGEVFHAVRGRGAYLNGTRVHCTDTRTLTGQVLLTELGAVRVWPRLPGMLRALEAHRCATRIMGSSALSLASIAAGRAVAVVLDRYSVWDVLAAALIATESGAVLRGRSGDQGDLPMGGLIAVAPGVADVAWRAWTGN